jgi:uncharacterized protein (TIGR00266 family)
MKYRLDGTTMQMLNCELKKGEVMTSESGRLVYMSDNIDMQTTAKGGIFASIKRKFAGESFFLVQFKCTSTSGLVAFGSEFPGKIIPLKMKAGDEVIAQKDAFLCSEETISFDATFTKKMSAGFLGGEGLILIKLKGTGTAFLNVGGEVTELNLKKDQKIRVDTSNLAAFDSSVDYSVERVKGVKNIVFGGEGLFLATLTGSGRVWIQSMPVSELAGKLAEYMPSQNNKGTLAGVVLAGALARR